MPSTDHDLLLQHHQGNQSAFAELTNRHIHWIYSAALRRTRDPHLAEDVTQAVLLTLATNRAALRVKILPAWLFAVLRYTSANAIRSESRRRKHETAAAQQNIQPTSPMNTESDWQSLSPHLESAVASLRSSDRAAILLRFYQQLPFADVAAALNISEEAARKRVTRAVARLRTHFASQKLTLSGEALAAIMFDHCTHSAPPISSTASTAAKALHGAWLSHKRFALGAKLTSFAAVIALAVSMPILLLNKSAAQNVPATQPVAATSAPAIPADSATQPSNVTFDEVIASIRQTEHAFQNVHIKDFLTITETRGPNDIEWKPYLRRWAGSAWFTADPDGPERLYFTDEVQPWIDGPAPVSEDLRDLSWDGKEYRELRLAGGWPNHMTRTVDAQISSQRSIEIGAGSRQWAGLGFTAQYYPMFEERAYPPRPRPSFSDMLITYAKRMTKPPDIWQQTVNGLDTIRIHHHGNAPGKPTVDFSYWFAPSRGFAFVKEEDSQANPNRSWNLGIDILELKQVGPNLWFPSHIVWTENTGPQAGDYTRYTTTISQVTVNDPAFDNSVFSAKIPTGWLVMDDRTTTRRDYLVMPDGSQFETRKGVSIPFIRPTPATRPDGDDPPITHANSFGMQPPTRKPTDGYPRAHSEI